MKLPWFTSIVLLVLWFSFALKRASRNMEKESETFWNRESRANRAAKKSLDSLDYIEIPLHSLPFPETEDNELLACQAGILELAEKQIVNLTGISNTELKLEYGTANLNTLISYDQNFTSLARLLYRWGVRLDELSLTEEAVSVLEFGVRCRTDISGHYALLAKLYSMQGQPEKIRRLMADAETLDSLMKPTILRILSESLGE
ncbi:globin family protein [Anaerobium acetethylicum]|uniref:Tetratricopeptide repeat-containing protein n=1 Tax=Anaerobium acetethylicum TaxID=1619234 RepID=A0A1D3TX21_9FIRM|nr:hypothetical protein [Anaerobium acetethylicum]SCP98873.1 hypothetical protein SAMN05421730_10285 [Anaerobium acetethylicum]